MKMQKQSFAIKKADVLPLCIMGQPGRDYFCLFIILVLCYLYSWRKPFFPEGYAYSQTYFLCPAFRPVCLCGAIEVLYRIAAYPYTLVMGERSFTGCFSYCYFVGDHDKGHTLHWFHPTAILGALEPVTASLLLLIRKPVLFIRKAMKSCNGRQNF